MFPDERRPELLACPCGESLDVASPAWRLHAEHEGRCPGEWGRPCECPGICDGCGAHIQRLDDVRVDADAGETWCLACERRRRQAA